MLRVCVLDFKTQWDDDLPLCEFAYNNIYHATIGMTPYKALYGRRCRTLACWDEVRVHSFHGPTIVGETSEKVKLAQERLKTAWSCQKSYADTHLRDLEFQEGHKVFLKVSPVRGPWDLGRRVNCWRDSFEILKRVGDIAYKLALLAMSFRCRAWRRSYETFWGSCMLFIVLVLAIVSLFIVGCN